MLAKSLQSCPTLCNSLDCSLPSSSVHGILQAGTLEWVAVPSSRGSSRPRDRTHVSAISCTGRRALNQQRHLGSLPVLWGPPYPPRVSISIHNDLQEIKSWLLAGGSLACQKTFDNRETFLIAQTVSSVSWTKVREGPTHPTAQGRISKWKMATGPSLAVHWLRLPSIVGGCRFDPWPGS